MGILLLGAPAAQSPSEFGLAQVNLNTANAVLGTAGSVVQPYQLYYGFQAFSA